jgi:hypothetical protein
MDRARLSASGHGHPKDSRFAWYFLRGPAVNPDEVSQLTGMTPDTAWHVGDPKPRTGIPHTVGFWSVDSGLTPSDEFHEHLDALLERLRPSWSTFVALGQRFGAGVDSAIYLREAQGPLVQLLPDVAAALSELNATLGFDLYALVEESTET